jgi:transposase
MSGQVWGSDEQVERRRPHVPKSRIKPRLDDSRVLSGIVFVLRNGLRRQDVPAVYGPHKTSYDRFPAGVFAHIAHDLAKPGADGVTRMMDRPHLKAYRTAARLRERGSARGRLGAPREA